MSPSFVHLPISAMLALFISFTAVTNFYVKCKSKLRKQQHNKTSWNFTFSKIIRFQAQHSYKLGSYKRNKIVVKLLDHSGDTKLGNSFSSIINLKGVQQKRVSIRVGMYSDLRTRFVFFFCNFFIFLYTLMSL